MLDQRGAEGLQDKPVMLVRQDLKDQLVPMGVQVL